MIIPRLLIAGQSSGVGKTTITLGLIAALSRRGLKVQSFKCGPDYIDPTYHALASGRPCRNLDTWMLSPEQMTAEFERASVDADIAIIEGVMGLFDGSDYIADRGSSAHIAQLLDAPILLVLDIGKMARSAGALALGYQAFAQQMEPKPVNIGGVILNRAGSQGHADGCAGAIRETTGLPMMGWLSKHSDLHIPERHLGLVPTDEREALDGLINKAAGAVEDGFAIDKLVGLAGANPLPASPSLGERPFSGQAELAGSAVRIDKDGVSSATEGKADNGKTLAAATGCATTASCSLPDSDKTAPVIAVARDEAFSFYYPANLEQLDDAGARVAYFSPLRDESLPVGTSGVYLGGGFPEVYAQRLSQNGAIWEAIRSFYESGQPIYAECGGFMVLTESIVDTCGEVWPFCGIIPGVTQMRSKLAALGYRVAEAQTDNLLVNRGQSVRGHEFHYSAWQVEPELVADSAAWRMRRRNADAEWKPAGYVKGNLLASYLHVHFGQDAGLARRFVASCR